MTKDTDARMWRKFQAAENDFQKHVILIEWQDGEHEGRSPSFIAWVEGANGLAARVNRGITGYSYLILGSFHA